MASLTQWTWVWVDSRSWWWTGRSGVLRFMGSRRVGHNWVGKLNWIELGINLICLCLSQAHLLSDLSNSTLVDSSYQLIYHSASYVSGEKIGGCSVLSYSCFYFQFFSHGSFYYLIEVINLHLQGVFLLWGREKPYFSKPLRRYQNAATGFYAIFLLFGLNLKHFLILCLKQSYFLWKVSWPLAVWNCLEIIIRQIVN